MVKFRGLANDAGEEIEDVVEEEGETLELQEARVTAMYQRGLRLFKERRLADATQVWLQTINDQAFERDVTGNPRFITLRNVQYLCVKNLAAVAEDAEDKEAALEWLGQAVALDDRDVVVWHKLGCIAQDLDRMNVARCSFERALYLRPQHTLCMERLCEVTYSIGDFEACESTADQLLNVIPSHPRAQVYKSMAMKERGKNAMYLEDILADARDADPQGVGQLEKKLADSRAKRSRVECAPLEVVELELVAVSWRCLLHQTLEVLRKGVAAAEKSKDPFNTLLRISMQSASTDAEADGLTQIKLRKLQKEEKKTAVEAGGEKKDGSGNADEKEVAGTDAQGQGKSGQEGEGADEVAKKDNGTEEAGKEDEDAEEEEFDDRDALCVRCGGDNEADDDLLLCVACEACGRSFHLTCLTPPLAKTPKGKWFCDKCDEHRRPSKPAATPKPPPAPSTPKGARSSGRRGRDTGGGGGGGSTPAREESPNPTPTKRRKSDRFSQPPPDSFRKSARHSAAAGDLQRPAGAEALSKIVSLVLAPEATSGDKERVEEPMTVDKAEPAAAAAGGGRGGGRRGGGRGGGRGGADRADAAAGATTGRRHWGGGD